MMPHEKTITIVILILYITAFSLGLTGKIWSGGAWTAGETFLVVISGFGAQLSLIHIILGTLVKCGRFHGLKKMPQNASGPC